MHGLRTRQSNCMTCCAICLNVITFSKPQIKKYRGAHVRIDRSKSRFPAAMNSGVFLCFARRRLRRLQQRYCRSALVPRPRWHVWRGVVDVASPLPVIAHELAFPFFGDEHVVFFFWYAHSQRMWHWPVLTCSLRQKRFHDAAPLSSSTLALEKKWSSGHRLHDVRQTSQDRP